MGSTSSGHNRKVAINGVQQRLFPWIRGQPARCKSEPFVKAKGKEFSGKVMLNITWSKAKLLAPGKGSSPALEVTYIRI